jgi:hypothetical protein
MRLHHDGQSGGCMKAYDTIRRFRAQVVDRSGDPRTALLQIRLFLFHLADAADFAQLADGKRLRDGLDFTAWLRELEACVVLELERDPRLDGLKVVGKFCHACGHVHQDRECGKDMGGAGVCKCDVEVVA